LVQHRLRGEEVVVALLRQRTALEVRPLLPAERLQHGCLYVCPSHAQPRFTAHGAVALEPLQEGERVSADGVLASAAEAHGPAVLAAVLSGRLQDGALGVRAIKRAGGRVIVQHPDTCAHGSMPMAALATGCVDACLPPRSIADAIRAFVGMPGAAALFATRPAPWASRVPMQPVAAEVRSGG
jgi:two-component system, chemotaxis family, protein-glutamate methylesterase/glutaminase